MEDDFFDNQNNAGANSPSHVQSNVHPQAEDHYDDFFGNDQPHVVEVPPVDQNDGHYQTEDYFGNQSQHHEQVPPVQNSYVSYGETSTNATGYGQGIEYGGFEAVQSVPRQLTEQEERRQRLQKEEQERTQGLIQKQRNPWEKITDNISLKVSEHPGEKDVSRMRESILNKKSDMLNAKI